MLSTNPPVSSALAFVWYGFKVRVGTQASLWPFAYLFAFLAHIAKSLHMFFPELLCGSGGQVMSNFMGDLLV